MEWDAASPAPLASPPAVASPEARDRAAPRPRDPLRSVASSVSRTRRRTVVRAQERGDRRRATAPPRLAVGSGSLLRAAASRTGSRRGSDRAPASAGGTPPEDRASP